MASSRRLLRPSLRAAAGLSALLVLSLGLLAGLCRFTSLNCHLREGDPFVGAGGEATGQTTLPDGFSQEVVAANLALPTSFALLPDGRLLVAEKEGSVLAYRDGRRLDRPLLDISGRVAPFGYRGLLAIEPDPDFARNGFLYALYVYDDGSIGNTERPTSVRLSRFVVSGDRADARAEQVLVGTADGRSCNAGPRGADCIPCDSDHCGGDIEFSNGRMFVSTGDGWSGASGFSQNPLRAQSLDSLGGKVLRLTPRGEGVPGNPFWTGDARANRSRIWAYGFRNPFRLTVRPQTGEPYLGDVGWNDFEEVNAVVRGGNFGWPCYEGRERPEEYADRPLCRRLYARGREVLRFPEVIHENGSVTGGVFYTGAAFPQQYRGAYFYGDWSWSWLRTLRVDGGRVADAEFAEEAGGPVQFENAPDGSLLYLAVNAGELRRIRYTG